MSAAARLPAAVGARRRRARVATLKSVVLVILLVAVLAAGYLAGGFLRFTEEVSRYAQARQEQRADAIVVLTGGSARIDQAIDLLKQGWGDRLLISGVNPGTSIATLARMTATDRSWFDCCVDIDYAALDTIGNAEIAAQWARRRGFDDLILVTSDYHMPRSLLEFTQLSGLHSVIPHAVRRSDLWKGEAVPSVPGLRVLLVEYAKLVAVRLRSGIGLPVGSATSSQIARLDL
ncbi:YdcF family protein [Aurantimonas sp. Leaf443]|uniref:YdcF family protein n=1 Tax=Aurantimonas sp. Leaf443 TaxID=1736378 RepID=UPI0006F36E31|nr:YdcF family protein [Aurantimonas sp. Leaf443]KQT85845.1 hypothetical protein ASG48_04325 [Aurantimonas sp. Leaf443]